MGYLKLAVAIAIDTCGTAVEICLTWMLEDGEIGGSASARAG
jgi:hypothetical protein